MIGPRSGVNRRPRRRVAALVRLVAMAALAWLAAVPAARAALDAEPAPRFVSLAGRLLIATPAIRQGPFVGAVVFILKHTPQGAAGLIVNRPVGTHSAQEIMAFMGLPAAPAMTGELPVYYGGPVGPTEGFVLHTADYVIATTQFVTDDIAMTSRTEVLKAILAGNGPRRALFAVGYAGWGPGQLDGEVLRGTWGSVAADEDIIFDADDETKWERAIWLYRQRQ